MKGPIRRMGWWGIVIVVAALGLWGALALRQRPATAASIPVEPVERRDIQVTVEATGTVEPVDLVEVKSKASGQIMKMPVEVGAVVRKGDLLAQIDEADVRNQYDQAKAALNAAEARSQVSEAQKRRADELFAGGVITAPEHESAVLDHANAQSALVKARTDLDIARVRLEDATVRAPIDGTVLEQPVAVGQVISSATSSVSGGTTLLKMADLRRIRVRVKVNETDIGSVRPGQSATVQVDAYPQRTFQGQVEKIEPQAVVEQSVTMFPVLVSLDNPESALLPGMNGEVTMLVAERTGVLSVPVDALRAMREINAVAPALGLEADSVRARLAAQTRERMAAAGDSTGEGRWGAGALPGRGGDSARAGRRGAGSFAGRVGADSGRRARWRAGATGRTLTGGTGAAGSSATAGSGNGGSARRNQAQVVFVQTPQGFEPRLVRIGVSNFDYAQVLAGVTEGESVAMLGVAEVQAQRSETMQRIRQRMGSGVPGVGGTGSTTRSTTRRGGS